MFTTYPVTEGICHGPSPSFRVIVFVVSDAPCSHVSTGKRFRRTLKSFFVYRFVEGFEN